MNLKEKLVKIYESIDHIAKKGHNKVQNYDYIKNSDVTHAIRKQLAELKVYAEIDFTFVGAPYTIARAKDKDAPFSAVNVRCFVLFHDLESPETLSASGLGSGCDGGDKAVYKAQTGALKYALKNAFLVPDEADPEADESVDEASEGRAHRYTEEPPDFREAQDARHAAPRPTAAVAPRTTAASAPAQAGQNPPAPSTATPPSSGAVVADAPSQKMESVQAAEREPGDEDDNDVPPTEEQMEVYRTRFKKLSDDLSANGKLTASKGLQLNRKVLVWLLDVTKATEPKRINKQEWENFFARVDTALANPEVGLIGIAKLINKANGIDSKK